MFHYFEDHCSSYLLYLLIYFAQTSHVWNTEMNVWMNEWKKPKKVFMEFGSQVATNAILTHWITSQQQHIYFYQQYTKYKVIKLDGERRNERKMKISWFEDWMKWKFIKQNLSIIVVSLNCLYTVLFLLAHIWDLCT